MILEDTFQTYGHRQCYINSELSFCGQHCFEAFDFPVQTDTQTPAERPVLMQRWAVKCIPFLPAAQAAVIAHVLGIALESFLFVHPVKQCTNGHMEKEEKITRMYLYCCQASYFLCLSVLVATRIFEEMDNKCRVSNEVGEENRIR